MDSRLRLTRSGTHQERMYARAKGSFVISSLVPLLAPGGPGIEPRWTRGAKVGVGTAYSTSSRVWYTLDFGCVSRSSCRRDRRRLHVCRRRILSDSNAGEANNACDDHACLHRELRRGLPWMMVVSYWEQACAFLNYGLLHEDLFFETSGELFGVWERVKPSLAEGRKRFANPLFLAHLEKAANRFESWIESRAPGQIAAMRQMMTQMRAQQPRAA
jgi:glucodextranase-like protein